MFKVLFVDNDATLRMIGKKAIEGHWDDCKVVLAVNGAEALKLALKEQPVLIILDLIMPGFDGVETLKKLREQGSQAPVIFVTAREDASELQAYSNLGVKAVLQKPFVPRTLLEECSKILDQKS
ncbi:MAG: response regulator [Candidatus Obscuribacterales bacterium]|nr:response regulator [Candidatus Obscuribacterales bacterium]